MNPRKPIPSKIKAYAFFSLFMPFYICRCSPNPLCLIGTYPLTPGDDTSSSISNNPIYQDAPENTKLFMYPHPQHPLSFPSYLYQERCQKVKLAVSRVLWGNHLQQSESSPWLLVQERGQLGLDPWITLWRKCFSM